ncbi:MAG: L-threonylcarbamoyladenylate synthase [Cyanobacteria bacterium P01_D01_bin.73]
MAQHYQVHPETPQQREIDRVCDNLRRGKIALYPTDTVPAIGCDMTSPQAVKRVRQIKRLSNDKPLTFLCSSLSNISDYAVVSDEAYRLMRQLIPGPYTFVLPATKLVPRIVMDPRRKTTGIRVPDNAICQSLLQTLGNPVISTSAHISDASSAPKWDEMGEEVDPSSARLWDQFDGIVDLVVDDKRDEFSTDVSTVVDLTTHKPNLLRKGIDWETVADLLF